MYSNNNKAAIDNSITVTPIKLDVSMSSHSYPTPSSSGNSAAVAATTWRPQSTSLPQQQQIGTSNAANNNVLGAASMGATPKDKSITPREKPTKAVRVPVARKPPPTVDTFWPSIMAEVRGIEQVDAKHQALPLARIKKIMKLDENAKMIAAEAPLLFAKACEYFIQELTMRAWIHTEESKRRTLQRSDIAQAIANYDQFDFLIDIVPREDIKLTSNSHKKDTHTSSSTSAVATTLSNPTPSAGMNNVPTGGMKMDHHTEMISFGTLTPELLAASQQQQMQQPAQQQLQIIQQAAAHPQQLQYFITTPDVLAGPHAQQAHAPAQQQQLQIIQQAAAQPQYFITAHQPQQLILTTGPNGQLTATPAPASTAQQQQAALLHNLAAAQQQQQQQQQIQLLQQVVTPTGELTSVPISINANQLNLLRLQMQPAAQQLLQLGTTASATSAAQAASQHHQQQQHNANIFINSSTHQNQQPNSSIVSTDRNLGSTYRPNC